MSSELEDADFEGDEEPAEEEDQGEQEEEQQPRKKQKYENAAVCELIPAWSPSLLGAKKPQLSFPGLSPVMCATAGRTTRTKWARSRRSGSTTSW
eukprot:1143298-Pelagomonas_calceolata.AAC.1